MTEGYLYCQVMRPSLPSSGINRYSRPNFAFPNLSLSAPSLFSYVSCLFSPVYHHVLLLSFMSSNSQFLLLYKSSAFFSLLFQTSLFFNLPLWFTLVHSLFFNLFSNSKMQHFLPLELYRHIIVMYHPPNTVPMQPSHWGHLDLPNTSVTVLMSQGSGMCMLAHCGLAGHLYKMEPNPLSFVLPAFFMASHRIAQLGVRKVY